jgi:hypothetical protein
MSFLQRLSDDQKLDREEGCCFGCKEKIHCIFWIYFGGLYDCSASSGRIGEVSSARLLPVSSNSTEVLSVKLEISMGRHLLSKIRVSWPNTVRG